MIDPAPEPHGWATVKAWRKSQRAKLIAQREGLPEAERKSWNERITQHLISGFDVPDAAIVGYCWPYKGEYDARYAVRHWRARGVTAALPEVTDKNAPLQFRKWWPGAPMRPGVYEIPVPDGTDIVVPDVAVVPMNAFDAGGFRLGYGGGFFDSTLASLERRIVAIGVTFELLQLHSIYPQPHDVPMDFVVTEAGIRGVGPTGLELVDALECRVRFKRLLGERKLPRETYRARGCSSPACYAAEFPEYFGEEGAPRRDA